MAAIQQSFDMVLRYFSVLFCFIFIIVVVVFTSDCSSGQFYGVSVGSDQKREYDR